MKERNRRRRHNKPYADALDKIRSQSTKTCNVEKIDEWNRVYMTLIETLCMEKLSIYRSQRLWKSQKRRQSAFARWADRMTNQTSSSWKRSIRRDHRIRSVKHIDGDKRRELRDTYMDKIRSLRQKKKEDERCIVFFGDGKFSSTMRGSAPIAKKAFLKTLQSVATVVWIDEFKTSQMCPCGLNQLRDAKNLQITGNSSEHRFRCHKTTSTGSTCPLDELNLQQLVTNDEMLPTWCDRDALATRNILNCAERILHGLAWPQHLRRSTCTRI